MISNQILQNTIEGLKAIARVDFCVMDTDGKEVASTLTDLSECGAEVAGFAQSPADSQEIRGCQYFKIFDEQQLEYVLVAAGADEDAYVMGKIAAFQIQNLLVAYKERFDKDNFIKSLLLDNLLLIDIYSRAKKLHIQPEANRVVLVIETANGRDSNALETMRGFFGNGSKDFVTAVDENYVIIVKDLSEGDGLWGSGGGAFRIQDQEYDLTHDILHDGIRDGAHDIYRDIDRVARSVESFLLREGLKDVRISYGMPVKEIKEVSRSYKEAKMAMDVGKIFFDERSIIAYSELGIGRLIYQLPLPLCKMFIKEIFGGRNPNEFDEETLTTINKFFENSLNVSETSRQLFIHRNTLVYRLDKLQKSTGLDLRIFEDAITFRIALMVVKYMDYMESLEY